MMQNYPSVEQLAEMVRLLTQARIENWLGEGVGSWRWWALVVLMFVPWFIWAKLVDKKKLLELALFGMFIMVNSITLDELGFELSLWNYPVNIFPIFPRLSSADYTVMPVVFMLTYQYFPTWKSFFWALVALAFVFSFVVEPIIGKLGFYVPIKWHYHYSFVIYLIVGLLSRWLVRFFVDIMRKHNAN
ncbi:CBO0543 family protein [Sporomusa malonica]|uniref:Uncharacterized protein n=1 Tax=Sporomusa malonica TaxID=112901 RepID=A0A1W2E6S3_9FIRM|nr:CBO0543 family protein [Sporomusa malonica]SMD05247.1 hypothetical protein SAMN04488500_12125 [Sporomusa malonica]